MILVPRETIDNYLARGWWGERMIGEIFLETAQRQPEALAVADPPNRPQITADDPEWWTWGELQAQVGRYVAFLDAQGVKKDDVIVVQLPNVVQLHALYLACAISGVIVSPVPVQYRAHELAHVLGLTGARVALVATRIGNYPGAQEWLAHRHLYPGVREVWALGGPCPQGALPLSAALEGQRPWSAAEMQAHMRTIGLTAHDVLTICWTSGTEAQPKGVPRNHNEWLIVGQSVLDAADLQPGAQMLMPFPFVNMAGVSSSLMSWLLIGGGLHQHHPFDLDVFIRQLRENPIDYSVAAPAVLNMLLKEPHKLHGVDLSRLRRVGSGGGPLSEWMVQEMQRKFGIQVVNYFGSNEGAALSSSPGDIPDGAQRARYFPRFGVPGFEWKMSNARKISTRLVDLDTDQDITVSGQVGELRFKGPTIFSGYYRSPELTARAFDAQGYYRTGDLFEIAGDRQQFYRFSGRHKDIVIRGGANISSEEVEGLLVGHPKVRECAVVGYPDPVLGERVCAVVVPQDDQEVTLEELVAHLRDVEQVAAFKWPEKLIVIPALPRNPVGKILKRELRTRFFQQEAA
jgi:acyl-CoA synthetase (AMP-forming)/AMP-acid ligase II